MKNNNFTPETISELLIYLAENESFTSVKGLEGFTQNSVKDIFKDLAQALKATTPTENSGTRVNYRELDLSPKAQSVLSCLSPREELLLFKTFKLI